MELTQEWIKEYAEFSDELKTLVWKKSPAPRAPVGKPVGAINNTGYWRTKNVLVHRLVWLYHKGVFPDFFLDHINGDRLDNRIENLRPATKLLNNQNRFNVKGYTFDKTRGKFKSAIRNNYKQKNLGYFNTAEEAQAAYFKAKEERDKQHG